MTIISQQLYEGVIIVCNHIMDLWKKFWGVNYHLVGNELEVPETKKSFCKQSVIDASFKKSGAKNQEDPRKRIHEEGKIW